MILQALTDYYRTLEGQGQLSAPGWSPVKVSFALCIDQDGTLERVISLQTEQMKGKKTVLAPQSIILPAPVKRSSGIAANFLCDNSSYILGVDNKGKPQRSAECFAACKALHEDILKDMNCSAADAILAFFRTWNPEQAAVHPALTEYWEDIMAGANLVFRFDGTFIHTDPAVRQAWNTYYQTADDGPEMVCLVTGEKGPVELVHPSIKNVQGAQSSGAALVSFNAPAFCSYGKEQNLNAPTSKYAAFAYTAALNHLLTDRDHVCRMGDATVVCWAKGGGDAYQNLFGCAFFGQQTSYTLTDIQGTLKNLCAGQTVEFEAERLDPNMEFYVLGLSPNAARLSVRFFLRNTFGAFLQNVQAHQERLEIVKPSFDKFDTIPLWKLLYATIRSQSKYEPNLYEEARAQLDKNVSPVMAGEILRAVLMNTRYPESLHNGVVLRIRAERNITRSRIAILKAYMLKKYENLPQFESIAEVFTMNLNESCINQAYVLGRLFSVMEKIQLASADWKISRTIKDSYFNSAANTPKIIFSRLFPLSEAHMKKLMRDKPGLATTLNQEKKELISKITQPIPVRFSPDAIDCFYIGYYHQDMKKKEEE